MSEENDYEVLGEDFQNHDLSFKIIVIGDSGVGKSSLTTKATKDYFENYYSPTVGFEFYTFNVRIIDKNIRLQIWDTCGQEVYRSLINGFYRSASLAILVYSIDNNKSFNSLESWLNEIKTKGNPNVKLFLIGNKIDLKEKRKVTEEQAKKFHIDYGFDLFLETSAKTGFNSKEMFIEAAKLLYRNYEKLNKDGDLTKLNEENMLNKERSILKLNNGEEENHFGCC